MPEVNCFGWRNYDIYNMCRIAAERIEYRDGGYVTIQCRGDRLNSGRKHLLLPVQHVRSMGGQTNIL